MYPSTNPSTALCAYMEYAKNQYSSENEDAVIIFAHGIQYEKQA